MNLYGKNQKTKWIECVYIITPDIYIIALFYPFYNSPIFDVCGVSLKETTWLKSQAVKFITGPFRDKQAVVPRIYYRLPQCKNLDHLDMSSHIFYSGQTRSNQTDHYRWYIQFLPRKFS